MTVQPRPYYPKPKEGRGLARICVDLDGTLAQGWWPDPTIGSPIDATRDAMRAAFDDGWEIVIYTSRPASHRDEIRAWLDRNDMDFVYDIITDKISAAAYWDDRAVEFPL